MNTVYHDIFAWLKQGSDQTEQSAAQQLAVWGGTSKAPPLLLCVNDAPEASSLPRHNTVETRDDAEKMLLAGLHDAIGARAAGMGAVPSVRANMGCGVYAALFGLTQAFYEDKMPWLHERLSKEAILRMSVSDLRMQGDFLTAIATMRFMKNALEGTGVAVFPLDLQGVVDLSHLILGDDYFYELYDDVDGTLHLASLCAEALTMGTRAVFDVIAPDPNGWVAHYNDLVLPAAHPLKISEDTSTLLSQTSIESFAVPQTQQVLRAFGGGYMHFCGKNPFLIDWALRDPLWRGLNFGNPDMHDMLAELRRVAAVGKVYYGRIPNWDDAPRRQHFRRIIDASRDANSMPRLLLSYSCNMAERDAVAEDWVAAGGGI